MLPNEPKSQLKRYRFNHRRQSHNNQQVAIWGWIVGLMIIIFLILGGIKLVGHHKSSQIALHNHVSRRVSKSTTPSANQNNRSNFSRSSTNEVNDPRQRNATATYGNYVHHPSIPPQPRYHQQRFASVNNAKEWAKATQQRWLHQGYTNYRVSSDGQGNYYLQFTK